MVIVARLGPARPLLLMRRRLLAACLTLAGGVAPSPQRVAAGDNVTGAADATVEVALFEGGEGMEFYEDCQREYERLRPGVRLNVYGDPRIDDKLRVRIMEGRTPDLTNAWQLKYHELIQAGRMQAFDAWLDQPSFDTPGK